MRNLKRVLSLALALVMVLGMMVIGTSAATFTDAEEITYTEAVDVMSALGVINGYQAADGTFYFDGDKTLTRAEGAALVCYMLMGKTAADKLVGSGNFTDVAVDHWASGEIDYCYNLGLISGNGDGTFNPGGPLTSIAFGRMLLGALGYDGAIEGYKGDNWASAIASDIIDAGLDVNGVAMDAQMTREQAAQMAFQALTCDMVKYQTKGTSITIDGIEIVTGASDAAGYTGGVEYNQVTGATTSTNMQFVEKYFKTLSKQDATADAFGRPAAYKWVITPAVGTPTTAYTASATPVMSSTTTITADELYNTLGYNATIKATGSKWTDFGSATANKFLVGTTEKSADYAVSDKNQALGGNGIITEVYKTATANQYIVVQILPELEQIPVATEVAATNTNGAYKTYSIDGQTIKDQLTVINAAADKDNFVSDVALTKDAWVMAYGTSTSGYTFKATTAVTGKLSSYNATLNQYTVAGTTYAVNASCADLTGLANGTTAVYLYDNYGYIAGYTSTATPAPNYAVVTEFALVEPATTGAIGSAAQNYLEAEVVFLDGTVQIVKVAQVVHSVTSGGSTTTTKYSAGTGAGLTQVVATGGSANLSTVKGLVEQQVVKYAVDDKGVYTLTTVAQANVTYDATLAANAVFAIGDDTNGTGGSAAASVANNNTIFVVRTGAGNAQSPYKYSVCTGYANLNTKLFTADTVDVTAVNYAAPADTSVAQVVYITGTDATANTDGQTKAFVFGAPTYTYVATGNAYYTWNAIINGAATTIKVDANTADLDTVSGTQATLTAGTLYTIVATNAKGYVSSVTSTGATTATSNWTGAKDGTAQLATGTYKSYNDSTVVYYIDATLGTVKTIAIEDLGDAPYTMTSYYITYVQLPNGGGNSNVIAQIIAVK